MGLCLTAHAQPQPQTDSVRTRFTADPLSLWRPSGGFGIGGSMETVNLLHPGSTLRLRGYVSQHRGSYIASFAPRDLLLDGLTSAVDVRYETHGRLRYHGIGPATDENVHLFLDGDVLEAGGYVGYRAGPVGVIGTLHARTGQLSGYRDDSDNAFLRLDERSAAALRRDSAVVVKGFQPGGTLYLDARDSPSRPTRGVLLTAGADVFSGAPASLYQPHASATVYVPVGGVRLVARALAIVTRPFDADDEVPIMLMPGFDTRFEPGYGAGRLLARDLALADVRLEHPIDIPTFLLDERLTGELDTDVFVMVAAFNAYDDLFRDLRGVPTWKKDFPPGATYGLRMAVGVGLNAYDPETDALLYTVAAGRSAEGWTFSTLTFNLDPRNLRSLWRW